MHRSRYAPRNLLGYGLADFACRARNLDIWKVQAGTITGGTCFEGSRRILVDEHNALWRTDSGAYRLVLY